MSEKRADLIAQLAIAGTASASATDRKSAWGNISVASGKEATVIASELAAALKTHPITVRRWMNGENVPRQSMMTGIRAHILGDSDGNSFDGPQSHSRLDASNAAIWTLERYLDLLPDAKAAFIFKSQIEMHAASNFGVLNRVQVAFDSNDRLTVYYVVVQGTKADDTYDMLEDLIKVRVQGETGILNRLRKITVKVEQDAVGVGKGLPSPFVVLFKKDVWRNRQHLAILYEMPVVMLDANQMESESQTALVQVPTASAVQLWKQWGPEIGKLKFRAADGQEGTVDLRDWRFDED